MVLAVFLIVFATWSLTLDLLDVRLTEFCGFGLKSWRALMIWPFLT